MHILTAAIAANAIATAIAMAAAVSATTSTVSAAITSAFWFSALVLPLLFATIACPCRCCCWPLTPLSLMLWLQTTAPCSFRLNRCLCSTTVSTSVLLGDDQNITETK
jgi:hypothetical protein